MSTPAVLAVFVDDVVQITTVHWGGEPSDVGYKLKTFYNSPDKAKALSDLGNLSSIGRRIEPDPGEKHTFDKPAPGVTVAYHRDRGEDLEKEIWDRPSCMSDLDSILFEYDAEYWYVFMKDHWRGRMPGCFYPI